MYFLLDKINKIWIKSDFNTIKSKSCYISKSCIQTLPYETKCWVYVNEGTYCRVSHSRLRAVQHQKYRVPHALPCITQSNFEKVSHYWQKISYGRDTIWKQRINKRLFPCYITTYFLTNENFNQ